MIKVGFCVAYDWEMLKVSIPKVYEFADAICLSIDRERRSWSGTKYEFDEQAFSAFLAATDTHNKIAVFEGGFSDIKHSSRENCNLQRKEMAEFMGEGGWHIQVDADEYFIDFERFTKYLLKLNASPKGDEKPMNVCAFWIPLVKRLEAGYLYVNFKTGAEVVPIATNVPDYQRARHNGHFNHLSPFYVVHETWARETEKMSFKLNNWGHSSEELRQKNVRESYLKLWNALDENNFQFVTNFHPAKAETWPELKYIEAKSVNDVIEEFKQKPLPLRGFSLFLRNNRNWMRIMSFLGLK